MLELLSLEKSIPAMSETAIEKVRELEALVLTASQVGIATSHLIHAELYVRTILIPKGVLLTGALIKIATVLIVSGRAIIYLGDKSKEIHGYEVISASANRKQAFYALEDTHLTMIFSTNAKTVKQAEEEFTDEANMLFSRAALAKNNIVITGE